ncbi:MAG: iron-sulfur cluster assembly scaffold protein [Coriobacteriia bacterium]|nr:iron-sulfur cluster assembly scaffold protein [Coriobacteriia bacterium]
MDNLDELKKKHSVYIKNHRKKLTEEEKKTLPKFIRTENIYQDENDSDPSYYSDQALHIVANCRNAGIPEDTNAVGMTSRSKRNSIGMQLFAVYDPELKIFTKSGFRARGCIAMIASASIAASLIHEKTLEEALQISKDVIREKVGGVPSDKSYTFILAEEAIRACVGDALLRLGLDADETKARVHCDERSINCITSENCSLRSQFLQHKFS